MDAMSGLTPTSVSGYPGNSLPGQNDIFIERATVQDADHIKHMVVTAYSKYVERMGKEPAPMKSDYHAIILAQSEDVYVLRRRGERKALGAVLLSDHGEGNSIKVNNLVVDPATQGRGYGRLLMNFAEEVAWTNKREAITLFTNENMYENIALYPKMGFVETGRMTEDGYRRVYFRKYLAPTGLS